MAITPPIPVPSVRPTSGLDATAGTEPELGQAERTRVVDQGDRDAEADLERRRDGWPDQWPGMLTRNRAEPVAGSYSPGTPTPSEPIAGRRSNAVRPIAASRPMTASGPSLAWVGTWPRSIVCHDVAVCLDDGPLEVRDAEVDPEVQAHDTSTIRV